MQYNEVIAKVKRAREKDIKEPSDYELIKRFDMLEVAGLKKRITPVEENSGILYFVHDEELY